MREGIFTYRSNISLGKGFTKPWLKVKSFMEKSANNSLPSRVAIELVHASNLPTQFFNTEREILDRKYEIYGWNYLGDWHSHQWVIPNSDLSSTLSRYEQFRPFPKQEISPARLNIRIDFELIDKMGKALPFQSTVDYGHFVSRDKIAEELGLSRANIYLSENSTMELFLCVPFESMSSEFLSQVEFLKENAQFKFNSKMWKYWEKAKNGKSYKKRKVVISA